METLKRKHEKFLAWQPDQLRGERSKREKVVVVKNLFAPAEFDGANAAKILTYTATLRETCGKFGTVRKVVLHDKHAEGVAVVHFAEAEEADLALASMDGRIFFESGRVMKVEVWDGRTKYKVAETAEDEEARRLEWEKFLEEDDEDDKDGREKGAEK